jgi:hypothetical protein
MSMLLSITLLNHPNVDFFKLTGRIPWNGIAEHPAKYVAKKSRPDSDHQLQEPSHMKSDGVDAWLQHWLKLQKWNKRPLVLKDGSDKIHLNPTASSKQKAKASKAQSTNDNNSDNEDVEDNNNDKSDTDDARNDTATMLPSTPLSASGKRMGRREFLAMLSDNRNYQKLLLLLHAAKVGNMPASHKLYNLTQI